jgi:signal transduction histidine kinase
MASPTLDSVSVDIVFQFLRATIRTGDTVAKSDPALWRLLARPELRAEASLVPLLFAHFDRIAATFEPLGDDGLWALANSVRGQFRAAAMQRCLQILSRPSYFNDRWAERAYFLVAQYPNSLGGDLLTTLWTNQGIRAIPTLTDLLSRLNAAQKTAAMRAYEDLPAECFQDAAFVDAIVESCMSPRHDSALVATRILTRGLARAQIAAWGEMQQLDPMVNWNAMVIQAAVPAALRRDAWLQWLTADSEEVEEIVAGRVRESIALLQRTLDDSEDLARLHGALDDFLRKRLDLWPEAQLSDAETDLCAELARRTEGGNRSALSLAFATLNVGEPLLLSAAMARVWLVTSRRMAQSIYSQVAAVSRPQLHAFKNELAKFADVGVAVPAQTVRTLRNMLVQEDSYLRSRRRAYRTSQDVRSVVESAVFRPPFVATWLRGSATAARFFVLRPADAIIAALDRELIVEAIHTLVQNAWTAVKDLGERGYVSVESARVNDSAIISVIDNGGGVSKIMLAALNAPDAPTTRGKVGFGARLVWQVARLHGGNIQYSFTPGSAGLRAQLEIPLSP